MTDTSALFSFLLFVSTYAQALRFDISTNNNIGISVSDFFHQKIKLLARQLDDGIIDETEYFKYGDEIKLEYEYRNITSTAKGLHNIKNVIKQTS